MEEKIKLKDLAYVYDIMAVEKYLGGKTRKREAVLKDYKLKKHPSGDQFSRGSGKQVFKILCEKFPLAKNYIGWGDVLYSMKNAHAVRRKPLAKMSTAKEYGQLNADDCKALYKKGDIVYIVNLEHDGFEPFKAKIVSHCVKQLSNDKYDICYELSSPCFGINTGWKYQGNNSIFPTMEEAKARAIEKNTQ